MVALLGLVGLGASPATDKSPARVAPAWPQWRGPLGTGVAPGADPPLSWSETENTRFKVELPGKGHSSPVVWGDRIFVTSAEPVGEPVAAPHADGEHDNVTAVRRQRLVVLALDRFDGKQVWRRELRTVLPHESSHQSGSWASQSPVTDGRR